MFSVPWKLIRSFFNIFEPANMFMGRRGCNRLSFSNNLLAVELGFMRGRACARLLSPAIIDAPVAAVGNIDVCVINADGPFCGKWTDCLLVCKAAWR